ncbi:MAG: SAF domain-containing protein, partial [Haloechinothrix sp.]
MEPVVEAQPRLDGAGSPRSPRRPGLRGRLSLGHVIMIVSGLLAFLLTFSLLRTREVTFRVAVAARDIPAGTPVDGGSFRFADIRAGDEVLGTLVQPNEVGEVSGWIASATVRAGDLVSRNDLLPPAASSGLGAMSIPI